MLMSSASYCRHCYTISLHELIEHFQKGEVENFRNGREQDLSYSQCFN